MGSGLKYSLLETIKKIEQKGIFQAWPRASLNPLFIQGLIFKDYKRDSFENRIVNNNRKLTGRIYVEFDKALLNNATLGEVSEKLKEVFKKSNYESYSVQFADITEGAKHIKEIDTDFILRTLDYIKVFETGKIIIRFMDGTEMECNGE